MWPLSTVAIRGGSSRAGPQVTLGAFDQEENQDDDEDDADYGYDDAIGAHDEDFGGKESLSSLKPLAEGSECFGWVRGDDEGEKLRQIVIEGNVGLYIYIPACSLQRRLKNVME